MLATAKSSMSMVPEVMGGAVALGLPVKLTSCTEVETSFQFCCLLSSQELLREGSRVSGNG